MQQMNENSSQTIKELSEDKEIQNLSELENDENYFIDYIDCYLFDQNENRIGKIVDVVPIQGNDVLLIDTNLGQKMVPFAKQLILFFDKNSKK